MRFHLHRPALKVWQLETNYQQMKNIAIFASGNGSNAEQIIRHFNNHAFINISLILSNRKDAFVLERAKNHGIKTMVFSKSDLYDTESVLRCLFDHKINFIVLAGFLLKIPDIIIRSYNNRIINIHPALLPDFGGKGMYGMNVHNAVIDSGKKQSGITIHYVDEIYDNGKIIFQAFCDVSEKDTAQTLAEKIHQLEHKYFPRVIEFLLT
jgi:phosphoribosylglycinamide formyltransferase 1